MRIKIMIVLMMCVCLLLISNSLSALEINEILKPQIDKLIQQLGADDWEMREKATEELIALGHWARPGLESALNSPDAEVRTRAQQIRIVLRWKEAFLKRLEQLTNQLRKGTSLDQNLLNEVISFLGKGDSCLVLIDLLRDRVQPVLVRQRLVNTLAGVSEGLLQPAIPELLKLIKEETDPNIKYTLLNALGRAGKDERVIATLKGYLDDPNSNVRITAIQNLGRLGSADMVPLLIKFLKDPDDNVKAVAVSAIQNQRTDEVFNALLVTLKEVNKTNLKTQILHILSNFNNPRLVPVLIEMFKTEKDQRVFQSSLNIARRFKDNPELKKVLIELLRSSDTNKRSQVLGSLAYFGVRGDPLMKQVIRDYLDHPDPANQSYGLSLVVQYGDKTFASEFIKRLAGENDFNKFRGLLGNLESISGQKFFPQQMPATLKAELMVKCRQWWVKECAPK
ncbi:HEAT repeat domain-containing protein [Planctomycetota bacterium]